jgi:hypothetical protein
MLGSWSRVGWGHLSGGDLDFGTGNFRIGAEIFREASPLASRIYLTIVQAQIEGDTYIPEWNSGK